MGMVVRTNTMAINAYRQLGMNNSAVAKSLEKLASGYRINRAGDDAAGLAISEKMKAQITGLETASANAQDGISLIQTAEGNLGEVHDMLNRMVELATKSANGTYTQTERDALQAEVDQLLSEIDRISKSANFNGAKLLDGSLAANNAIQKSNISSTDAAPASTLTGEDLGVTVTATHMNGETVKTEQSPEFAINFEDVKFELPANTSTTATATYSITIGKIGGVSVTIVDATADLTKASTLTFEQAPATDAVNKSGDDIANALNTKFAVIGNAVYSLAKDGTDASKVKFTYAGVKGADGAFIAANDASGKGKPTDDMVKPYGDVTVSVDGITGKNRIDCHVVDIKDPQAGGDVKRSGATLQLTQAIIDGGSLKIGDTTFNFDKEVEAGGTGTPTNATPGNKTGTVTIGIKGLTGQELLQKVTEQMSHCNVKINTKEDGTGTDYTFNVGRGADLTSIEIEEYAKGANPVTGPADYGKFTEKQLKAAFEQAQAATKAKVEVTLAKDTDEEFVNVSAGNTLKVGDTTYKFTEDGKGTNEVKIGDTAVDTLNNLKAKLDTAYTVTVDTTNGKITIENKEQTPEKAAEVEYTAKTVDNGGLTLQIGDTADDFNKMTVAVENMSAKGLGLDGLQITKEKLASDAIDTIKNAINSVSTARAGMGALQNRLEHTINNLDVAAENLSAANSRIRDTDMAKEMMNYTKMNVLVQSAQAMLAQANQQPQSVLQLLQ